MKIFAEPPRPPKNEDIFKDVNSLVEKSFPNCESDNPIFRKFGTRTGGMIDTWILNKNWKSFSNEDKWKYVAYCALYWQEQYKYWLEQEEYEQYLSYLLETGKEHPEFLNTYNLLKEKERNKDGR